MKAGQGLLLSLDFADGGLCKAQRTFLIIEVTDKKVRLLNVSSIEGKERKLAFSSNEKINKYRPPFMKKSFCKMDAVYIIPNNPIIDSYILAEGRSMHPEELSRILLKYQYYRENNEINIADINLIEFCNKNAKYLSKSK